MEPLKQFEADWTETSTHGALNTNLLYQELLAIESKDGGPQSPKFKADLAQINKDLYAAQALQAVSIAGVDHEHKAVLLTDGGVANWDLIEDHGMVTGVVPGSSDGGLVVTGSFDDPKNVKPILHLPLYADPNNVGPLGDVTPENVIQGQLGDCYFMSSLSELASKNPGAIRSMIATNSPGDYSRTFTVTFPGAPDQPVVVSEPNAFELSHYGHAGGGIWAAVIEKAHRKLTGRILADSGDSAATAMALLTARESSMMQIDAQASGSAKAVSAALVAAQTKRELVIANSADPKPGQQPVVEDGIMQRHSYSVLGYNWLAGSVTVRDPGGSCTYQKKYSCMPSGVMTMQLNSFIKSFPTLVMSESH